MVVLVCNLSTWELVAKGLRAQVYPQLHTEFEASLGYIRSCLKQNKTRHKACFDHEEWSLEELSMNLIWDQGHTISQLCHFQHAVNHSQPT